VQEDLFFLNPLKAVVMTGSLARVAMEARAAA
jgi:hypothetical protein